MNKKISVITPSFNKGKHIETAILSVLLQNYADFEHIIVDGVSIDGTIEILKKYRHLKWISEKDLGQSDAMNKGFRMAQGDIIVYLNADDFFLKNAFRSAVQYFENDCQFLLGNVLVLYGNKRLHLNKPQSELSRMLKWWENDAYSSNPVGYFYGREVQEEVGEFNINNHYSMDYEFLLKVVTNFKIKKVDIAFGVFRIDEEAKTYKVKDQCFYKYFKFCDQYVAGFDSDYQRQYHRERKNRIRQIKEVIFKKKIKASLTNKKIYSALYYACRVTLLRPNYGIEILNQINNWIIRHV